jgi:hypothetical protein
MHASSEHEPMMPVFEQTKTFHALDRVATVVGVCTRKHRNSILHVFALPDSSSCKPGHQIFHTELVGDS